MLEDDEGSLGVVVDCRDAQDRRLLRRGEASSAGEESLAAFRIPIAQELDGYDQVGGLVVRAPDLSGVIPAVEGHEAIAASDELPFLVALREQGVCGSHPLVLTGNSAADIGYRRTGEYPSTTSGRECWV